MKKAVIFGAGKIARGFVAQLLSNSGYEITFVEINQALVKELNDAKQYTVHILGNEARSSLVNHYHAVEFEDIDAIAKALSSADLVFTSVGGKNLQAVGAVIAQAWNKVTSFPEVLNFITCENWKNAGKTLDQAICDNLDDSTGWQTHCSVSEGVIMRIATQPSEQQLQQEPLGVWVQNFWELPINQATFKGETLSVEGMKLIRNFGRFLEQKMYTNNTSNAFIAYVGYMLDYRIVAEAANASVLQPMLDELYKEINETLIAELHVDRAVQEELSCKAREKYSDWEIVDQITRHAKDPIRKLGPEDRLIAPARMALQQKIQPNMMVKAIAAALYFYEEKDESACELQNLRRQYGTLYILKNICQLSDEEPLTKLILDEISYLKEEGLLHE